MPDTHATRYTDTACMIPEKVSIPLASLDDHLTATAEHLIKLIINKKKPIGPHVQSSTKQELLQLASILKRDTTPPLKNLPKLPTSENDQQLPTTIDDDDITIKTSNTSNSSNHPTLEGGGFLQRLPRMK